MASIVELCRKRLQWRIYLSDKQECPEAIRLLTLAGIVTPVVATSGSGIPLDAEANDKSMWLCTNSSAPKRKNFLHGLRAELLVIKGCCDIGYPCLCYANPAIRACSGLSPLDSAHAKRTKRKAVRASVLAAFFVL